MRVLLNECVPRPIKRELPGHDVWMVVEMGWSGKENGELLQLMRPENFSVFLTVDQNVRYQQNLLAANVAVVVLAAMSNRLTDLLPLMPAARAALGTIKPGDYVEVRA
jgi:hypothetical protein